MTATAQPPTCTQPHTAPIFYPTPQTPNTNSQHLAAPKYTYSCSGTIAIRRLTTRQTRAHARASNPSRAPDLDGAALKTYHDITTVLAARALAGPNPPFGFCEGGREKLQCLSVCDCAMPRAPLLRVPYTDPLPAPKLIPASATTASGAIAALVDFLSPSLSTSGAPSRAAQSSLSTRLGRGEHAGKTLLLTGAGISVASGLADYRGTNGTYTLNKTYRPVYFHEFCDSHEARKRYWARSFLGWTNLEKAKPNKAHEACGELGRMGVAGSIITQSRFSLANVTAC